MAVPDAAAEAPAAVAETEQGETADSGIAPEAMIGAIVAEPAAPVDDSPLPEPDAAPEVDVAGERAMMSGDMSPATSETFVPGETAAPEATTDTDPARVPVMDPVATADSSWPVPETAPEAEPEPVTAGVDHTSAAVRLLRSVAPWTAPTHAGSSDRSESE
jgi:hypothetical protein